MKLPVIAFCTTCKGRAHHIEQTLPKNLADNQYKNSKFILLDYSSDDDLIPYLKTNHSADIKSGKLVVYSFPFADKFHISHAKNMAHRLGILEGADLLVTLDADNFTHLNFDEYIYNQFSCNHGTPDTGMFLYANITKENRGRFARGVAGRLVVRPQDFIKAGGYNEKFDSWGREDIDLNARLRRLGYGSRAIDSCYLDAVRHNSAIRFKEYPEARQYENDDEVKRINRSTDTVVNFGKFGVGTVYKNFGSKPIKLAEIPTRVFGIGLHKTATSSLHKAFQILGFDSFHWGTGEAPLMWNEMNSAGRSKTLERWYSLCDLPIPLLYKQLDIAYPNSKFVLTIRDEEKWIKSVERLWDPKYNPTRWEWDIYPFSNNIHTVLYGQRDFNHDIFLERYRRHNTEVREYFKSRPDDLLIMNMDKDAGWKELCGFLKKNIPECSYPREYRTKKLENVGSGVVTDLTDDNEQIVSEVVNPLPVFKNEIIKIRQKTKSRIRRCCRKLCFKLKRALKYASSQFTNKS